MIGRTLGPYQLIERLDRADGYETYRAIDPRRFGQPVAVALVALPDGDEEFAPRFERLAQALTELRHPNILPLLDFGEAQGQAYLVTPHLEGPTLASILGRPRRPAEALGLIGIVAEALDFAHRHDLAHGELTPETIQVVNLPPGEETLFGAWPLILHFGYTALLGPGAIPGSIADGYRAPAAGVEPRAAADTYALAGVLHALLTGVPPTVGGDATALATLPEGYAATLRRALSADPVERYATCPELLLALRDAAALERRSDDGAATALLDEARTAVAAGKFRAASEAYGAYLRLRPQDELARREFATIESRRAEVARRRADAAAAAAATAQAAARARPAPEQPAEPAEVPAAPAETPAAETAAPTIQLAPVPPMDARPDPLGAARRGPLVGGPLVVPNPPGRGGGGGSGPPRAFDPLVSPARERRRAILPGALVAIALLLAVVLGGAILSRRSSGAGTVPAGGTPGGTPVAAAGNRGTVTGSARPSVTTIPNTIPVAPTVAPIVPTPTPTIPPLPAVITDPFDNPASGFPPAPGGREGAGYQSGEYVLIVPDPDGYEIAELGGCPINGNCTFGDFQAEVEVRAIGATAGGSYGLVFHRQFANAYTQYFLLIYPEDGTFELTRWADTQRFPVVPRTPHAAIARAEAKNRITVTTKGTLTTVQINGVEVARVNDPGPTVGLIGLRADAGVGPFTVAFDNFIIRPVR